MPHDDIRTAIHLLAGDPVALEAAGASNDPSVLVASAVLVAGAVDPVALRLLARAGTLAATSRERQQLAIAEHYINGAHDRAMVLAREHLVDHPEDHLVAWIVARSMGRC